MRRLAMAFFLVACASTLPTPPVVAPEPVSAVEPAPPAVAPSPPEVNAPLAPVAAVAPAVEDAAPPEVKAIAKTARKKSRHTPKAPHPKAVEAPAPKVVEAPPPKVAEAPLPPVTPALPVYTGPQPCQLALKGDSPVARACSTGGTRAAKTTMKDMISKARDGGLKLACDDCHQSEDDYAKLTSDARNKFARLLRAAR